jgi:hypothetical protein
MPRRQPTRRAQAPRPSHLARRPTVVRLLSVMELQRDRFSPPHSLPIDAAALKGVLKNTAASLSPDALSPPSLYKYRPSFSVPPPYPSSPPFLSHSPRRSSHRRHRWSSPMPLPELHGPRSPAGATRRRTPALLHGRTPVELSPFTRASSRWKTTQNNFMYF